MASKWDNIQAKDQTVQAVYYNNGSSAVEVPNVYYKNSSGSAVEVTKQLVTKSTSKIFNTTAGKSYQPGSGGWVDSNAGASYGQQGTYSASNGSGHHNYLNRTEIDNWLQDYQDGTLGINGRVTKIRFHFRRYDYGSAANRTANIFWSDRSSNSGTPRYYGSTGGVAGFTHPNVTNNSTYDAYGVNKSGLGTGNQWFYADTSDAEMITNLENGNAKSIAFYSSYTVSGNNYATYLFTYNSSSLPYITVYLDYDEYE